MTPDLQHTQRYLDILGAGEDFTFQTLSDREELKKKYTDRKTGQQRTFDPNAKVFHGTLTQHGGSLVGLNNIGAGIFVMLNRGDGHIHEGSRTCRTNANVVAIRGLLLDLDGSPLEPVLEAADQPTVVVQTSLGRWHAVWLVNDCPLDRFSKLQAELAERFSGDPSVTDLARVIRLPGFIHRKAEPFQSRIIDLPDVEK